MIPWYKLPKNVQRIVLAIAVLTSEAAAASGCGPQPTPMIVDPVPPPNSNRTPGPVETRIVVKITGYEARNIQIVPDRVQEGIEVRGTVMDGQGNPVRKVRIWLGNAITTQTNSDGTYVLRSNTPGSYQMFVGTDEHYQISLDLKLHDLATVDWVAVSPESRAPLPLAEIRTVKIAQVTAGSAPAQNLDFAAASPWPDAIYRWTVSGGILTGPGPRVRWQPPAGAGCYLLQVVADWDYAGLAVDAAVLTVAADGRVTVS